MPGPYCGALCGRPFLYKISFNPVRTGRLYRHVLVMARGGHPALGVERYVDEIDENLAVLAGGVTGDFGRA